MNKHILMYIFTTLLFAHLLIDFFPQPDVINENKRKWQWNLLHCSIYAVLTYLFLAKWRLWYIPLILGVAHFVIDCIKIGYLKKNHNETVLLFLIDQIIHLLFLFGVTFLIYFLSPSAPVWVSWVTPFFWNIIVILCAILLLIPCGGKLIKLIMDPFRSEMASPTRGFAEGGKFIGYLERSLILFFFLCNQIAAIGFLVTAKSIFRFSEIKNSSDQKQIEYIIIGTFSSFLYAAGIGWLALIAMG